MEVNLAGEWVYLVFATLAGFITYRLMPWLTDTATRIMARTVIAEASEMADVIDAPGSTSVWQARAGGLLAFVSCLLIFCQFGFSLASLFTSILALGLLTASAIDLRNKFLPDLIVFPLLWAGLLCNTMGMFVSLDDAVFGVVAGYGSLFVVCRGFFLLTGRVGMGDGDLKLLAAIGAWVGWQAIPMMLLLSSIVGLALACGYKLAGQKEEGVTIPFGPALSTAALIVILYRDALSLFLPG